MAKAKLPESGAGALEEGDIGQHSGEGEGEGEEEFVNLDEEGKADDKPEPEQKKKVKKAAAEEGDDLPEELKGKSPKELAKMYREAQSLIGRQGSELGEARKRMDALIQAS